MDEELELHGYQENDAGECDLICWKIHSERFKTLGALYALIGDEFLDILKLKTFSAKQVLLGLERLIFNL